jgi:drug/metabolite transporter (DMT)-like permease
MIYWRSIMLVFLGACSYGILSTFVKFAYKAGFSPGEVSGSQMFLAALLMWVLALLVSRERATAKQWLLLVGVGATTGLTGVFYYRALQYVPASIAIVLLFQFTWIGVLVEAVLLRRRPETGKVIALILLLLGTVLAGGLFGSGFGQFTLAGVLLGLLSAVTYALFIIFSGRVAPQVNPWLRSAIMLTGASLLTFIVYPPSFFTNGSLWNGLLWWGGLLALFGGIVPTLFFTVGVPHIGSGLATILGAAELPTAVFLSSFVLREQVGIVQWIGVFVILMGIAVPEIVRKKQEPARSK